MSFKPDSSEENSLEWVLRQFWRIANTFNLHTGSGDPSPPATGSSWNAHGNIATSDGGAANPLKIKNGSLWIDNGNNIDGTYGDFPTGAEYQGTGIAYKLIWKGSTGDFRAGYVSTDAWDDANLGGASVGLGGNTLASGGQSVAIGNAAQSTKTGTLAVGAGCQALAVFGTSFGLDARVDTASITGLAIGTYLDSTALGAVTIGKGVSSGSRLTNARFNSLVIGVNSTTGTLFLENARCGVNENIPLSTLDVGGSVGFQYTPLNATDATTYTITGDEYTFRIDLSGMTTTQDEYTIQLPTMSSTAIDRRVYYFKVTDITHVTGNHGKVLIKPGTGQYIEDFSEGQGHRHPVNDPLILQSGDAITIIANDTDKTWWVI